MRVVASDEAVAFVRQRGGRLFIWPKCTRSSCGFSELRFETSTEERTDREFRRVPTPGFELYVPRKMREPEELELALRRFPRRHVQGYWNGCVWII